MVGHSYICYAPLLHGCTSVIFEGKPVGTPDAGTFWRVIAEHWRAAAMFTAPTAFRAIKKEDPKGEHISRTTTCAPSARCSWRASAPSSETIKWARGQPEGPVYDHWWQTETGWPICGNPAGARPAAGEVRLAAPCRCPAMTCRCSTTSGKPLPARRDRHAGRSSCRCRRAACPTLWGNDERFRTSYLADFPGYYKTGDAGYMDEDGYAYVMTRVDDVINVAGHRLSTGQIEEVLAGTTTWPNARWSAWPTR